MEHMLSKWIKLEGYIAPEIPRRVTEENIFSGMRKTPKWSDLDDSNHQDAFIGLTNA